MIKITGFAILWVLLAVLMILDFWPNLPKTKLHWFLLIVAGPPIGMLGETFAGWLFSSEHGKRVSPKKFSLLRMGIVMVIMLFIVGFITFIVNLY
jgi:hypothetical protein